MEGFSLSNSSSGGDVVSSGSVTTHPSFDEASAPWPASVVARRKRMEARRLSLPTASGPLADFSYKRHKPTSAFQPRNSKAPWASSDQVLPGQKVLALRSKLRPRSARAARVGRLRNARAEETSSSSDSGSGSDDSGVTGGQTPPSGGGLAGEVESVLGLGSGRLDGLGSVAAPMNGQEPEAARSGILRAADVPMLPPADVEAPGLPVHGKRYGAQCAAEVTEGGAGRPAARSLGAAAVSTCSSGSEEGPGSDLCPPHGVLAVCGRRREMEDAVATVPCFAAVPCGSLVGCQGTAAQPSGENLCQLHFFGVYDGHGGAQAAIFCADRLHHALAEEVAKAAAEAPAGAAAPAAADDMSPSLTSQWQAAFSASFRRIDAEINGKCPRAGSCAPPLPGGAPCARQHEPIAPETVGSTAVVTVVSRHHIIVGNCGDSRAVLLRAGEAVALSDDHKPDRPDEMKRVEAAGGRIIFWNGYRILGVLAMSRAIGDRYLKPYVIAEPEVTITPRAEGDECVIMATDGLWDVMSNQEACDIAHRCLTNQIGGDGLGEAALAGLDLDRSDPAAVAAAVLTKIALSRGSGDNISVVVVNLRSAAM